MYYVYLLRCADGTLYTGFTNDLARRLAAHNAGRGAKYTRGRRPVELVYWESFSNKSSALRREYAIKAAPRRQRLTLIHPLCLPGKSESPAGGSAQRSARFLQTFMLNARVFSPFCTCNLAEKALEIQKTIWHNNTDHSTPKE